jgi:4-amino-4-deoxy-L-arabinose transferase-like glycosyltransferase
MADTTIIKSQPEGLVTLEMESRRPVWEWLGLSAIMLVSIFMNFYQLGQNGFGNLYYAAGVKSMGDSWHNFFFVSYDPGGFVTIDKPPLGFWLQVASTRLFGFTAFSIFLPQALAGVLSVLLLYMLVQRRFGVVAGLLAALALALSPISVVTSRNNTIDSTLVLTMLLAAWAVLRAVETGKLRWLLLCAVFVGIGFNVKMAEAYLVVPALGLVYLLGAPKSVWVRIVHLLLAALLMVTISFSWAVAVDLTPASQRPYVGSTQDNSEISLATGYNGIQRLLGGFGGFGRGNRSNARTGSTTASTNSGANPTNGNPGGAVPPQGAGGTNGVNGANGGFRQFDRAGARQGGNFGGGGAGGMFGTGIAGPLRLFNEPLGGQIVWLLPFAILGMIALAWQRRPRFQVDRQQQSLVLWGMWLLTMAIFFSVAGFFHQYYLTTMAPAICALFGIGVVVMWQDYRRMGWRGWLLPIALIVTAVEQIHIIMSNPAWGTWLIPLIAVPCALAALVLFVARDFPRIRERLNTRFVMSALSIGLIGLMLTSAVWTAIPVLQGVSQDLPAAGPQGDGFGGFGGGGRNGGNGITVNTALVNYLEANQGNAKFLVAVPSSMSADSLILATNKPVMALGGFSGSDPILTTSQLATLVANGTVRFFLLGGPGGGAIRAGQLDQQQLDELIEQFRNNPGGSFPGGGFGGGFGPGGQSSLTSWVTQNCKLVPTSTWQSSGSSSGNNGDFGGASQLYDCAPAK